MLRTSTRPNPPDLGNLRHMGPIPVQADEHGLVVLHPSSLGVALSVLAESAFKAAGPFRQAVKVVTGGHETGIKLPELMADMVMADILMPKEATTKAPPTPTPEPAAASNPPAAVAAPPASTPAPEAEHPPVQDVAATDGAAPTEVALTTKATTEQPTETPVVRSNGNGSRRAPRRTKE